MDLLSEPILVFFVLLNSYIRLSLSVPLSLRSITPTTYESQVPGELTTPFSVEGIPTPANDDANSNELKTVVLNKLFNESNYDHTIRPRGLNGTGPTKVLVWVSLRSVENVDDVRMQYSVQMVFRQEWIDPRLKYSHLIQQDIQYFQLVPANVIWEPDIFFRNEKSGYKHELIVPNRFSRLYPNGRVLQSYRISLVLSCIMDLRAYPLDTQQCPIYIESYGWTTSNVQLMWRSERPIDAARDFSTSRFHTKGFSSDYKEKVSGTGNYSVLILNIKFAREFGFYMIQIYLPCSMLVIVSWVSFWLDPSAVEARVSLGVTTILTIVTQTYGINQSAPPASYAKALDIWTAWCQGMVFGALIEFASVNYLCHKQKLKAKKMFQEQKDKLNMTKEELQLAEEQMLEKGIMHAKRIDRGSRIVFPLIFIMYNVFYWFNYLHF